MQRDFLALLSCLSRHSLGMDRIQRCQQQKQHHEPWSSLPPRLGCSHQGPHSVATKSRAFPDSSNLVLALLLPIPQTVTCHVLLPTPLSFPSPEQTQGTLLPSRPAQYFHAKCDHHALYSLPRPPKPLCSSLWRHSATQVLAIISSSPPRRVPHITHDGAGVQGGLSKCRAMADKSPDTFSSKGGGLRFQEWGCTMESTVSGHGGPG